MIDSYYTTKSSQEKRIDSFVRYAMRMQEENILNRDALRFMSHILIQAEFPHKDPKVKEWTRINGNMTVSILSPNGIPYGSYPRLLLTWITTEAVRNKATLSGPEQRRLFLGSSLSSFMKKLDIKATGGKNGTINRFKDQIRRLVSSTIIVSYDGEESEVITPQTVAKKAELFKSDFHGNKKSSLDTYIELSETFFDMITDRPIPVDMDMLRAIKNSAFSLDLYFWLTYRLSYLKKPTYIKWQNLTNQLGCDFPETSLGLRNFKRNLKNALIKVRAAWPELNIETTQEYFIIKPTSPHVNRAKASKISTT